MLRSSLRCGKRRSKPDEIGCSGADKVLAEDRSSFDMNSQRFGVVADPINLEIDGFEGERLPELAIIPLGTFEMGSPRDIGDPCEYPVHSVEFEKPFAIGRHPITFDAYDCFAKSTQNDLPNDEGWGRGQRPVINVSWYEAQAFANWLSEKTGEAYRLPSEAEWEYACRAGSSSLYWWGDDIAPTWANYNASRIGKTTEVGSYPANPWGLHDMHGNVWEWVQDAWQENYIGAPTDGTAWLNDPGQDNCRRVVRGGAWNRGATSLRASCRNRCDANNRVFGRGFRIARDLTID